MNIVGAMRVRNEGRWIRRSIQSILPICSRVVVFDDNSTDDTTEEAREAGGDKVTILDAHHDLGTDEVRDKNILLNYTLATTKQDIDWIVMIDGDEAFGDVSPVLKVMESTHSRALAFPILYLWDGQSQVRVDGVYGHMSRVSAFRPGAERFEPTGGVNFHCGNAPQAIKAREWVNAPILHYGYMYREDRIRKYRWYNEKDPNNALEDRYRHIVQGDVPEVTAEAVLMHAGPLKLKSL